MMGDTFTVNLVRFKTCFLYIPERWARKLQDLHRTDVDLYLKIIHHSGKVAYFSWQLSSAIESNCIGINATIANNLDLHEGDHVSVMVCEHPTPLQGVTVTPMTSDDLEIIESSSGVVQSTLLDQVRIVYVGQHLTIWISNALPVTVRISALKPDVEVGRLEQLTEMTVSSPTASSQHTSDESSNTNVPSVLKSKNLFSEHRSKLNNLGFRKERKYIFRVHPLPVDSLQYGPCDVFITRKELMKILFSMDLSLCHEKDVIVCKISKLRSPTVSGRILSLKSEGSETDKIDNNKIGDNELDNPVVYVRLRSMSRIQKDDAQVNSFENDCVFTSNYLRKTFGLEIGCRIKFLSFHDASIEAGWQYVELYPFHDTHFPDYEQSLIRRLHQTSDGLLLCSNMLLTLSSEKGFIDAEVKLYPSSVNFAIIFPEQLDKEKVKVKFEKSCREQIKQHADTTKPPTPGSSVDDLFLTHLKGILKDALVPLETSLGFRFISNFTQTLPIRCNVLIVGKRGSGKTTSAYALGYTLQKAPYFTHLVTIKCRPLRGKKVETILKTVHSSIVDCVYHQPSILIFDDLDSIAGVAEELDQNNPRSTYFNRVGKMLFLLLSQVQSSHRIAMIATAPSTSSLSSALMAPRGVHFFNSFVEQPELTKEDRQGILCKLLAQKVALKQIESTVSSDTLSNCALKAEGYSCQDLSDLVDKAAFAACKKQGQSLSTPIIDTNDMLNALTLSTPMLLRGVSLHKESPYVWDDIGGLAEVKDVLREVLQWPVMYPSLFCNSPLRHQSGLLLYGAPGTGKTMLAGAVANECGLNFISIKGPELLSKYIGASEASVRNIFQRAQSAKPCVLFFDEFDSLAPRRGHDSTGVTDRVVNQLLTQLDGVESLSGVWVLAATSRPDLLDPALLRPGRLDRSVLCPLPSMEDRLAILHALSRKLCISHDANLASIADVTDGYTGADLQSILYTSQLHAVEETQSQFAEDQTTFEAQKAVAVIHQKHLDNSLRTTRPSLSPQERQKYFRIYEKFRGGRNVDVTGINTRATLA